MRVADNETCMRPTIGPTVNRTRCELTGTKSALPDGPSGLGENKAASESNRCVVVNPMDYPGWDSHVSGLEGSSVFHSAAWAQVLHRTYGHKPACFCRLEEGVIKGVLPVMEVRRPFTGRRGISLPFSDHCSLAGPGVVCAELFQYAKEYGRQQGWRSFEIRSIPMGLQGITPSLRFYGHEINLLRSEEEIWSSFKSRVRTPVRRAQEAGITVRFERSVPAVQAYYKLHSRTRKKHGLPPQPLSFFMNLHQCVLAKGYGDVALAWWRGQLVAAGVFMHLGERAIHKFGASNPGLQKLGANHLLMWETIRKYRGAGLAWLDLGRTSISNEGLRQFKQGFAGEEHQIRYCKYDYSAGEFVEDRDRVTGWYNGLFRLFPEPLLRVLGKVLYSWMS